MASSSFSSSSNMNYSNKINPLPASPGSGGGIKHSLDGSKPSTPRAVEVQRVVLPEMMQAVTQKTDDYLSSSSNKTLQDEKSRFRPMVNNGMAPPQHQQSSTRGQQHHQQRPPVTQHNGYSNQSHIQHHHHQPQPQQRQQQRSQQPPPQNQYNQTARHMNSAHRGGGGGGAPLPMTSHSAGNRRAPGAQSSPTASSSSPRSQQPPGRFDSPSYSKGSRQVNPVEKLGAPPHHANLIHPGNNPYEVVYSSSKCNVYHWINQSWHVANGQCLLEVRLTQGGRTCVTLQLQNTRQLYLNAWILETTEVQGISPTEVSISLYMDAVKETYLVHFAHPQDAAEFAKSLRKAQESSALSSQQAKQEPDVIDNTSVPQTLKSIMDCKAKLFIQNETSKWSPLGSVKMLIKQQSPSKRMMIQIEKEKEKEKGERIVSAVVKSGNVEMISQKKISFLLSDEAAKTSFVYMIQLREDQTGNKIIEYLRTKNAENGW